MFDIGLQEMLVIAVLALLVFGPSKLPELGRMVGRAMREFRRASDEFRSTVETNLHINEPDPVIHSFPEPTVTPGTEPRASAAFAELPSESESTPAEAGGVDASVAAVAMDAEPAEPFCAQQGSRLFHRSECVWVRRIPDATRVYWKCVADARGQGLVTCPVCEPWEPS